MARFYQKFGRGNRAPSHGAQHAGQAKASQRKRRMQALNAAALEAEAAKLEITVPKLRQRRQLEVNAIIAAETAKRAAYIPPARSTQYWWY